MAEPPVSTQTVWTCELSIMLLRASTHVTSCFCSSDQGISTTCCAVHKKDSRTLNQEKKEKKEKKRPVAKIRNVSVRFGPRSWPTSDRFAVKRSRLVRQRDKHSGHWSRCIPAPGPWAQGLKRQTRISSESDYSTAPTPTAARVRTIVSRCRGRLALSAYPHLQIRPRRWANVSASSPPLRAGVVAPPLAPKMDILNYSCPWAFATSLGATVLDGTAGQSW